MTADQLDGLIQYINAKINYANTAPAYQSKRDRYAALIVKSIEHLERSVSQQGGRSDD